MKLTLLSNSPWSKTGYGGQTRLFLPRFKAAGHDPACIAFYGLEGSLIHWMGIPVYPRHRHQYGMDVAAGHTLHHGARVMLSLVDAWILEPALLSLIHFAPWFPVDCDPLPEPITRVLRHAYERITMSRYGERVAREAGFDSTYIPHGYDPTIYHPQDKAEARKKWGWPADAFIASMVAANKGVPSRKAFPQQFEAFALLAAKHSDARLYVQSYTDQAGEYGGYRLVDMAERFGIADRVLWADDYQYLLGYPDEYMAQVYAASDVLLHVSMGEGFGIPIIEAQACGCPVIVGDWTSMGELVRGGWQVHQDEAERFLTAIGGFQYLPHPAAIADRLESAYSLKDAPAMGAAAQRVADDYAVDVVMERHWLPFLNRLEARVAEESRLSAQAPRELAGTHA